MAEQIVIELLVDDSQLQPAIDLLEKTGQIDSKLAGAFKQTTAEINKQAAAIKESANSTTPLKKNLEDVSKVVKNTTSEFVKGFQEGVTETLKEAGVSIIQFKKALGTFNQASPFDKLNKSLSDTSKRVLDAAARLEQLRRTGGAGTEAFVKLEKQLAADQQELRKLSDEFARVKQATDVFTDSENGAGDATESLRQRLRILTEQIAALKLAGQDNTEQFQQLVIEAGRVKDAMGDAGAEIRNLASDTGTFDGIISGVQGMTGAFAVGQGVVGLFGDESEELQKTLLKVNSVMAIAQGLQQVQNVLQKESAASRLLDTVAAKAQIVVQRIYTAVTGQATAATTAFKVALASTGIGLLVVGVLALVQALREETSELEKANRQLERNRELLGLDTESLTRRTELAVAEAEKIGKVESEITKIRGRGLLEQRALIEQSSRDLARLQEGVENASDAYFEYDKQIEDNNKTIKEIDTKLLIENIKFQKQLADEARKAAIAIAEIDLLSAAEGSKKQLEIQKRLISLKAQADINAGSLTEEQKTAILAKAERDRFELESAFDKRRIDLQLKNIETQLINVREGSQEEFKLRIEQLRLQVQSEIASTKLSQAEKNAIKEKGFQDELKLQREFNERLRREAIEGQIALNASELANVQITSEDKLLLTIANIELAAAVEVDAAKDNANKIKEINAKRDADIAATRKAFIEQQAQDEIDMITAVEGAQNRALQKIASDTLKSVSLRITALRQLADFEFRNIETREQALEEERRRKLISDEEYNLRYAQLQDEKARISQETEQTITDIHRAENEKRRDVIIQTTQAVFDLISQLNDIRTQKDEERIEGERARVEELLESGAITEKEAIARNKRIDAEEKKLKREAAQRDKQLAIFNAIIATAQAVVRALATPPAPNFVAAAIAGAFGAAQVALIASRPIPKFGTGKKNRYEGLAEVGETGTELVEHDGQMYVADKRQIVWLGKEDKVYTPTETKRMLPHVDKELMKYQPATVVQNDIDYEQLSKMVGKEVGKNVKVPGITVDENGFKAFMQEGMSRQKYMDKYYSSK